jgi:hypothetical protein
MHIIKNCDIAEFGYEMRGGGGAAAPPHLIPLVCDPRIANYSASRLSALGLFVVCRAPRGIQQTLCGLGN